MNAKQILLRVFSGILALVCVLSLVLTGYGFKQAMDCKSYWEEEGREAGEGFDKLEDGINQLRDNEDAYLTGVEAYEEGLEEYEKGEQDLEEGANKLSSGQAQYNDGASQLADAHQQYNENVAKIEAAKAQVEAGKADLEAGKAEVAAGEAELAAHQQEYEEGKAQLEAVTPIYNAAMAALARIDELKAQRDNYASMGPLFEDKVAELDMAIAVAEASLDMQLGGYSINGIVSEYQEGQAKIAAYEEGQRQVAEGKQKIAEGEQKIAESEAEIAAAEQKLAAAKAILDQKDQELANAGDELAAGYAAYEEGKDKLKAGAQQLSEGLAKLGEYEGGEEQVKEGLDTVLATDTYYDAAKRPLLPAIAERLDPGFSYWKLDENGEPLVVNGQRFLSLAESLKVVRAGREFLADTTKLVTEEITGRAMISALAVLAVLIGLVTAILGLAGLRIGALVCAVLSMLSGIAALALSFFAGKEDPFSVIAGTGTVGIVLAGVAVLVFAALLVLIFAAIPGSGRNKKAAPAPAEA